MEPGTIIRSLGSTQIFDKIIKSKQIIESAYEKSKKKITALKNLLFEEREQNKLMKMQLANMIDLEEKVKNLENVIEEKDKEIKNLNEQFNRLEKPSDDSDSDTWRQLYESTKYSKMSSKNDYFEISNSTQSFIEKIMETPTLSALVNRKKTRINEIKKLATTLNFEKLLFHINNFAIEIIEHYEERFPYSPSDSEIYTPNYKMKY